MDAHVYHLLAMRTRSAGQTSEQRMLNAVLGLCGESGEIADYLKKAIYHGHSLDQEKLINEAGDVLWYVVQLLDSMGVSLALAMQRNIEKLERRYPEGFSTEASLARVDVEEAPDGST